MSHDEDPTRVAVPGGPAFVIGAAQVGRYELLMQLASGGMATVFLGRQRGAGGFERVVAIKRMHPHIGAIPELAAAFMDEARIASVIHHPNVVQVQDVHDADGERLLVMEYVDGASLSVVTKAARKQKKRVPRPIALYVLVEALRGLHAAHEQRGLDGRPLAIVHRDATPQNILVGVDGAVKITDFGIARAAERSMETVGNQVKGKFRYMAPEQARTGPIDRRVDVFAMGVVAWELLANQTFFTGETDADVLRQIAMGELRQLTDVEPATPEDLAAIVMRALQPRPDDRWSTADEFARALESWARAHGELPPSADVAHYLEVVAGESIRARRQKLIDTLSGKLLPVLPGVALPTTGSASSALADLRSVPGTAAETGHRAKSHPRLVIAVVAMMALAAAVGIAVVRTWASSPASPAASVDSAPPAQASARPVAPRVGVTIGSRVAIASIGAPGIADITFKDSGATLTLPLGSDPVTLQIKLADGTELSEIVTPREPLAIQLRAPTPKEDPTSKPAPRTAPPRSEPRAAPPPGPGAPPLRKSPYDE